MKNSLLFLLGVLLLIAIGRALYKRFIDQPKITAEIFADRVLSEKKVFYKINYSGVSFSGSYDLKNKTVQQEKTGNFTIKTISNGAIFGLEVLKNNVVKYSVFLDLLKQKLTLNL